MAIAVLSLSLLIPVYYFGTDRAYNTNYLTFWSKITIPHLEEGSLMNYIPIVGIVLITISTMFFYQ